MKKLFTFIFLISLIGCKKEEDISDPFYFKGTVNGVHIQWIAPFPNFGSGEQPQFQTGMPTQGGSLPLDGPCYPSDFNYQEAEGTAVFEYHPGNTGTDFSNSISVYFARSEKYPLASYEEMRGWFTNGVKTFGLIRQKCSDPIVDGIVIFYTDANNKTWRSSPGDQGSNHFEQVSLTDETRAAFYFKKWTARFSCKLYDENGNFIQLSNCEIHGPVFPY